MTDPQYEAKYKEMQKYVPFIQRVIERLKVNNELQTDNPRKAQLQKMEMLHDLLTNKSKKIRMETLVKCEGVLIKLHAKIEKQTTLLQNEDAILSNVKLKDKPAKSGTCTGKNTKDIEVDDTSGPASPPPEVIADDIEQPVVIPTERRCSPILLKEAVKKFPIATEIHSKQLSTDSHRSQHSPSEFESLRQKVFSTDHNKSAAASSLSKTNTGSEKTAQQQYPHRTHQHSHNHHSRHLNTSRQNSPLPVNKPVTSGLASLQTLQTVKVVINEPLPAHVKQQHFPSSSSNFMPRASLCHNNLKTLPQALHKNDDNNEAYNPEESWEEYNESHNKRPIVASCIPSVFTRLGAKVVETPKSESATTGRYTPIPDVLKSPPLSATDINNLLLESGADKMSNDISEIGTRRPPKVEDTSRNRDESPSNSFEFVRKKLAQTAKINSPNCMDKGERNASPLPHERIALKYHPHPRQERLSISSTEGSECSTQSRINDPRIKAKQQPSSHLNSPPTQISHTNVNVLPAINLSDPRLKKQANLPLLTTPAPLRQHLLATPPSLGSSPVMTYPPQNPYNYGNRKDPRISRAPNTDASAIVARRSSTNQPQYSSEENWDTDEDDKKQTANKTLPPRLVNGEAQTNVDNSLERMQNTEMKFPIRRNSMIQARSKQETISEKEKTYAKPLKNVNEKKPESQSTANVDIPAPKPPSSDTEDDWDSEPETVPKTAQLTKDKSSIPQIKPTFQAQHTSPASTQLPIEKPPVSQIKPTFPAHHPTTAANKTSQIIKTYGAAYHPPTTPYNQPPYHTMGVSRNLSYIAPPTAANANRFSSLLNDKTERSKYFEAKQQKTQQPRTYKEFREAKERAQAQQAALKRAAEEAEAKKRAEELKESSKEEELNKSSSDKKETPKETPTKMLEETRKEKKSHPTTIEHQKKASASAPAPGESTLDKMYRTQNFNTSFPKSNTSFKIPKRKTEEKSKEECTKANDAPANKAQTATAETTTPNETSNSKTKVVINPDKAKEIMEILPGDKGQTKVNGASNSKPKDSDNEKPIDKLETNEEKSSSTSSSTNEDTTTNLPAQSKIQTPEQPEDAKKISSNRDPRCRRKSVIQTTEPEKEKKKEVKEHRDTVESTETTMPSLGDIVITSADSEVTLKPQTQNVCALDKFNKLTQEQSPKPQRVLRRRNTMVVFDSVPLVDKEKLRKANALLFEDMHDEEKRKRKKAEEERLLARRNRNLEEMFKKTDDNCTVSTQNIITGKRRTRASINFNETANAINVFKHTTVKESAGANGVANTPPTPVAKNARGNVKQKIKNEEDDEVATVSTPVKLTKASKSKALKEAKEKEDEEVVNKKTSNESEVKTSAKTTKKRVPVSKKAALATNNTDGVAETSKTVKTENGFKPITTEEEHQNCAVSSTSTENTAEEQQTSCNTKTTLNRSLKKEKETDDNEPTSTAGKSNNPTPTPEANVQVLNEIVDQILKPNADREHILGLLGQILSEDKLELINTIIESSNRQTDEQAATEENEGTKPKVKEEKTTTTDSKQKDVLEHEYDYEQEEPEPENDDEDEDEKPLKLLKKSMGQPQTAGRKKKRSELDKLNEDIRDMFICQGVLTATGRRMCTIMGKDVESETTKTTHKDNTPSPKNEKERAATPKKKEEKLKPPTTTRPLRRSLRVCKANEDNEDDEALSTLSRTTEESMDGSATDTSIATDSTPQRKMPVLNPNTPIKIHEEVQNKATTSKEAASKRKSTSKLNLKAKKPKPNRDEDLENEEKESDHENDEQEHHEPEEGEEEREREGEGVTNDSNQKNKRVVKNNNVHWHNQSKFSAWCMICEKRLYANSGSLHYKIHHGENYISRMAPVLLQQFKQGKCNQPIFGVKKPQKQPSWFFRCPFCLKYYNTPLSLWLKHFQNHTVEHRYECSKCHRCSNRRVTVARHIKNCESATIITSAVKLNLATAIQAHVCHLCNFIQLKRVNLERHYLEQHQLDKKMVDLMGYTITLFDAENVACVTEDKALERENEAWKSIEKDEQVIDIADDEEEVDTSKQQGGEEAKLVEDVKKEVLQTENENEKPKLEKQLARFGKTYVRVKKLVHNPSQTVKKQNQPNESTPLTTKDSSNDITLDKEQQETETQHLRVRGEAHNDQNDNTEKEEEELPEITKEPEETIKQADICAKTSQEDPKVMTAVQEITNYPKTPPEDPNLDISKETPPEVVKETTAQKDIVLNSSETVTVGVQDFEIVDETDTAQVLQDELLALAAKVAENEDEGETAKHNTIESVSNNEPQSSCSTEEGEKETVSEPPTTTTTISDLISTSIDQIYNRCAVSSKRKSLSLEASESKKLCQTASNVFMSTRDENSSSPTIQILAHSIINIDEVIEAKDKQTSVTHKPLTMAERISQRFKDLQQQQETKTPTAEATTVTAQSSTKENAFEKLVNETVLELEKEKDSVNTTPALQVTSHEEQEHVFDKLSKNTVVDFEKEKEKVEEKEKENSSSPKPLISSDVTVISDDEDWEDIEITETAPTIPSANAGNMSKSKNKGLFQKYGLFKCTNTKSKKHLTPMVFMPKKKTKDKILTTTTSANTTATSSPSPTTTTASSATTCKAANTDSTTLIASLQHQLALNSNSNAPLGTKTVINIMDDLLPDSPCNDPIDLAPELAILEEPLQDLNDISSILDSNLSAVSINPSDQNTSIEEALDFISEQQENSTLSLKSQTKAVSNNISHVGYSQQNSGENPFKFYCALQNCSFMYSSDSVGLETHFMCEHAQVKWNGFCLLCQAYCFPYTGPNEKYTITQEIHHMMEKHAHKPQLELNTDSTSSSVSSEDRPKIKLRRMTGDCLSRSTPENVPNNADTVESGSSNNMTMLGALLVAKPKPPTKEMPPQPIMPLTEPILLNEAITSATAISNVNSGFLITSVTSKAAGSPQPSLQISGARSLKSAAATPTPTEQIQLPTIASVRTLAPKAGSLWSQQIEKDREALAESAAESIEVSRILANAGKTANSNREVTRAADDSPVVVAETVPLSQAKTGDFVITQTVSAQYNDFSSAALGFNISIAASNASSAPTTASQPNPETVPLGSASSTSITARQYKCMGSGCKFVSRVPVAMSDHLRFHERRNFSNKRDYLACGFCFYCASDVEDYMRHADLYHIINKGGSISSKIQNILNTSNNTSALPAAYSFPRQLQQQNTQLIVQDTPEVYLKKLRDTVEEIVAPTGLKDDKLYRCVIKNCQTQLSENDFLKHILFHISSTGENPNNYVYKCPHCTAQYHRPVGIKAHLKNHARNRYFCYLCEETTNNPGQLLKHFLEKHWFTLNLYTKELLPPKISTDASEVVLDSAYFVAYSNDLSDEEVRKYGEKLILDWQRKKCGSKTHFKSSEIDLLPRSAIFQREVNCGECEYKTKVRTNMFRHLQMHKKNPGMTSNSGVDPVNPVPCLNSTERFFDKMTNLASSSLIPSSPASSSGASGSANKSNFKFPYIYVESSKQYTCGDLDCNYHTMSLELFRRHLSTLHSTMQHYRCAFCQEEICKRGITIDRIVSHLRFHTAVLFRCEECNYVHHMRYVVERHINEKHASLKVNIVKHNRSIENNLEGITFSAPFKGKKYKETTDTNQPAQTSNPIIPSVNSEATAGPKLATTYNSGGGGGGVGGAKTKDKWLCDMCGHKATTVSQIQTHCQQHHGVKNQYKCAHCNFGSQQLVQILSHIDESHAGKTREARCMYHKAGNSGEDLVDTRPLWQRNDPTRIRHIRGILMEDEEESEEYRKKLALTEDIDDEDDNEGQDLVIDVDEVEEEAEAEGEEQDEEINYANHYVKGYEFVCYHCTFKTQDFEDLKSKHYPSAHNLQMETAKPLWYRLQRRLCCPQCRSFIGNSAELQDHLSKEHISYRFCAADIIMLENEDSSQRILCAYCPFHCLRVDHLYRHHEKAQHWPQDLRIDNNEHIAKILELGKPEVSYQCTLCAEIFSNRVAIVQHACNMHAGEDSFSFRELSNSLIFRCNNCCFTSTKEIDLLRHMIDHYAPLKVCFFCRQPQSSFEVYMQHCYAKHKSEIQKFRSIYPFAKIEKFLQQMQIVFPNGLVLTKRNLRNTKYGKTEVMEEIYEQIYKISQQPPIPKLSIARLVARKSIEAQQKQVDFTCTSSQAEILEATQSKPKSISKRRRTVAVSLEDHNSATGSSSLLKPRINIVDSKVAAIISKRRITVDHENLITQQQQQKTQDEFSAPTEMAKISKRRRTVAVDRETICSSNLISNSSYNLLIAKDISYDRKRKFSNTQAAADPSPKHSKDCETYQLNLDMEPFSFYGQIPTAVDLTKIFTKVAIGGIKTPLTIDKFKLLFNIESQLKLRKCDDAQILAYNNYKHIKKACPASHKSKYN